MAIKKSWNLQGIELNDAVHKIHSVNYRKASGKYLLNFRVDVYVNETEQSPVSAIWHEQAIETLDNLVEQAYGLLKQKQEYAGSTDV